MWFTRLIKYDAQDITFTKFKKKRQNKLLEVTDHKQTKSLSAH